MKKYIILTLSIVVLLFGCSKDFLELEDPNSLTLANYPKTTADMEQLIEGVYGNQHAYGLYGHVILAKGFYCWDHTQDMAWQGTQTWINLAQNDTQPSDEFLRDLWRDAYKGVQRANTVLEIVEKFRSEGYTAISTAKLNEYEGQAHYLRAWFYYNLISLFGEKFIINGQDGDAMGVPIIKKVSENNDVTNVPRASVKEVWDFIIADLKTAETLLQGVNWTSTADRYKISTWGIKAFLGKVYGFVDDWNSAIPYLKDVIENSGKTLVPFDTFKNMFNNETQNKFNKESLIEINMAEERTGNANLDQVTGSWTGMIIAPSFVSPVNGGPVGAGWSNAFVHSKNIIRFGYNLAHYFAPNITIAQLSNVRPGYPSEAMQARTDGSVDPRLYVAALQPYIDEILIDGTPTLVSHYFDGVDVQMEAWSFRKYVSLKERQSVVRNDGANFYFLRLADVYLLYAEALIKTSLDPALGLEYINKVHRRAYNLPINTPSAIDYTSLTATTKASVDDELHNDPLKYERFAELFGEGQKWFDTRRWQNGASEAAYYQKVRGGTINWAETDYAQPIPTVEMESNSAIPTSKQNPGYH